jgi:uncharacterized protein
MSGRLGRGLNALYPRLTSSDAEAIAATPPVNGPEHLAGRKYCTVVSYRRDGTPVATPVWFGTAQGRMYFRSLAQAAKLRRIARDERVLVAPCTLRGRPTGPPFQGRARILEDDAEVGAAERAIQGNYGAGRRAYERAIRDAPARYVEVVPIR